MGIFETIYNSLDAVIVSTVLAGSGQMQSYGVQLLLVAIPIYMTLACYAVLRGIAGEGFGHVLSRATYASLLLAGLQYELGGVGARTVMEFPDLLAGLAGVAPPAQQADALVDAVLQMIQTIITETAPAEAGDDPSLLNISAIVLELRHMNITVLTWVLGMLPLLLASILGAVITAMLLFLKFALACCALFGPLFIAAGLFDWSRSWFFTWLSTSIGYAISTTIMALAIALISTVMIPLAVSAVQLSPGIGPVNFDFYAVVVAMLAACGVILVGFVFLWQAQGIAQAMIGAGGGSATAVAGALIPSTYTVKSAISGLRSASAARGAARRAAGGGGGGGGGSPAGPAGRSTRAKSNESVMRGRGSAANDNRAPRPAANG